MHVFFLFDFQLTSSFFRRMVVAGYNMIRGIFADSASVFRYDQAYGLNQEQVRFSFPIYRVARWPS